MFLSSFFPATTFLLLIFISLRGEGPNFLTILSNSTRLLFFRLTTYRRDLIQQLHLRMLGQLIPRATRSPQSGDINLVHEPLPTWLDEWNSS